MRSFGEAHRPQQTPQIVEAGRRITTAVEDLREHFPGA
jgi:hypothetical protein